MRIDWSRRTVGGVCALAVAAVLTPASSASAHAADDGERTCYEQRIPVSTQEGGPADQQVYGELCLPKGQTPSAVMLLTHGITYDHHYFDFPGFDGKHSYARSANEAGYATLTIDRLGSGQSSHPPGAQVGMNMAAWVAHQLVQKLRDGGVDGSSGSMDFDRVIHVGHSYGSGVAWIEASRYNDVDGVVLTGATHYLRLDTIAQVLTPSFIPAALDPTYGGEVVDPNYLTTRPGTRYANFMAPGNVEPAVVAADEELKQTVTTTELAEIPLDIGTTLDIRVPVLVAQGDQDTLFCGAGTACDDEKQLIADEAPQLGNPPCMDAYLQPGGGHDSVLMRNAPDFFAALNSWASATVPPDGSSTQGCAAFNPDHYKTIDPGEPQPQHSDPIQDLVQAPPAVGPTVNHGGQVSADVLEGPLSDLVLPSLP